MDNEFVKVNVASIIEVASEYNLHNKNILNTLSSILESFNSLNEILDTRASKEYQQRVIKYLNKTISSIEEKRIHYDSRFNDITNLYTELFNNVKESVDKTKNVEG